MTDTMPAFQSAIFMKAGLDMWKWVRGGLHQPPALESLDQVGGQRSVAVSGGAQSRRAGSIPCTKKIPIPTSPTWNQIKRYGLIICIKVVASKDDLWGKFAYRGCYTRLYVSYPWSQKRSHRRRMWRGRGTKRLAGIRRNPQPLWWSSMSRCRGKQNPMKR